jgi:hypothetical protein
MIDDIVFEFCSFILELPIDSPGGNINSYSLDGFGYDFNQTSGGETSYTFII